MRNRLVLVPLLATVVLMGPGSATAEIVDRIVATVNGEVITLSDFYIAVPIFVHLNQVPNTQMASRQGRQELAFAVLQELINFHLLDQQARQHELSVEPDVVDQYIDRISSQMETTTPQLRERLAQEGIAFEDFHEYIRMELTKLRVISIMVTSSITVSDAEVNAVFLERYPDTAVEVNLDLSQILLVPPRGGGEEEIEQTRQLARSIRDRIVAGESFEELAQEYSQDASRRRGGQMETIHPNQLPRDFANQVLGLMPGEISEVFQTRLGFHIVRLNRQWESESADVDRLRENIYREIQLSKQSTEIERYLASLHQDSIVQVIFNPVEQVR
ncbi:MAG: peptidylprolyl isomerase [Bradymonadales bacterium]|nr:peptidylprolyl isomerase [Bradymonadales bacterium]